jgi:hypothetical protein
MIRYISLARYIFATFLLATTIFTPIANAQEQIVSAYLFYGEGCPHCEQERGYISEVLIPKYPNLKVYEYEVYYNSTNAKLMGDAAQKIGVVAQGVPFLIIGDQSFVGFGPTISPQQIEKRIDQCLSEGCLDSVAKLAGVSEAYSDNASEITSAEKETEEQTVQEVNMDNQDNENIITLPIIGAINTKSFSLPVLTVVMGALDGFNPCALWTLLFLISLLLGMENRKRMWLLGSVFIVASAAVYFLFMSAWLNIMLFLGFIVWVRVGIGLVALAGGGYSIKEFFTNKHNVCPTGNDPKRKKTFEKLKQLVAQQNLWIALGGIVALAFVVNLVELVCSAGLPAVFTQILALNNLSAWQYYGYIALYIFFFMLDDLFVFFAAMITLRMAGITTKYTRASRLVGGAIMIIIGILLIVKPEWLMF